MNDFSMKLGEVIRRERLNRDLTQEALAALSDVNRTYLSEVERGIVEVSVHKAQAIAKGLGIQLSELIEMAEKLDV